MILSMKKITCWNDLGQKKCSKCREFKDASLFGKLKTSKDGYHSHCKFCISQYYRNNKYLKKVDKDGNIICRHCNKYFKEEDMKFAGTNKNSKRFTYCKECYRVIANADSIKRYGISVKQYSDLLHDQEYKCKICKVSIDDISRRLSVDHDHGCCPVMKSCGKCIRGLICNNCNMGLGYAKDSKDILNSMINYLDSGYIDFSKYIYLNM
jgi:hypothetical protein